MDVEANEQILFLSSSNASSKSDSSGTYRWIMDPPLTLIGKRKTPKIGVMKFTFYNYFLNIFGPASISAQNNQLTVNDGVLGDQVLTFPEGNYGITELNNYLAAWVNTTFGSIGVELLGNPVRNRAYFRFNAVGWSVEFTATSPVNLLGFEVGTYSSTGIGSIIEGTSVPTFDSINNIKVKCNLVDNSYDGGTTGNTIFKTAIKSSIGTYQEDEPQNVLFCNSSSLKGIVSFIELQLVDQDNNAIPITQNVEFIFKVIY